MLTMFCIVTTTTLRAVIGIDLRPLLLTTTTTPQTHTHTRTHTRARARSPTLQPFLLFADAHERSRFVARGRLHSSAAVWRALHRVGLVHAKFGHVWFRDDGYCGVIGYVRVVSYPPVSVFFCFFVFLFVCSCQRSEWRVTIMAYSLQIN